MHRFRFRWRRAVSPVRRGLRFPALFLVVAGLVAGGIRVATPGPTTPPDPIHSCKPRPPYDLQIRSTDGSTWNLSVHNAAGTRRVVVWMWSEGAAASSRIERQRVWAGTLQEQELRKLSVSFTPSPDAVRVWASVETPEQSLSLDTAALRGIAVAPGPAAAAAVGDKTHVLLEEPSGRRVEQFVGKGGLQ